MGRPDPRSVEGPPRVLRQVDHRLPPVAVRVVSRVLAALDLSST